jgi:hypothetical protein
MNALQRSLVEKAGHDFGFEYAVKETSVVLILGSARHPLQAEVRFVDDVYKICIANCRIPDDHISQRRYPWFVARDIMYHAIEQFIQQAQGGQST